MPVPTVLRVDSEARAGGVPRLFGTVEHFVGAAVLALGCGRSAPWSSQRTADFSDAGAGGGGTVDAGIGAPDARSGVERCTPLPWTLESADSVLSPPNLPAIAVGHDGVVHVSYWGAGALRYARREPGPGWTAATVWEGWAWQSALDVDVAGNPHVAFYDFGADRLRYARLEPDGAWTVEDVAGRGSEWNIFETLGVGVDSANRVHVSWFHPGAHSLRYARRENDAWTTGTLDSDAWSGYQSSLSVDSADRVHVSYFDVSDLDLRYAVRGATGGWRQAVVETAGNTGRYNDVAVDASGGVHISFRASRELRHAQAADGEAWSSETVDADAGEIEEGLGTSVGADAWGGLHMVYGSRGEVKYAGRRPGEEWLLETVGAGGVPAMDVDVTGGLHVAYGGGGGLGYAYHCPP